MGSGYIISNAAYHIDFYNQLTKDKKKNWKKGEHAYHEAEWNFGSAPNSFLSSAKNILKKVKGNKKS
jgi:hypothetical protein